MCSSVQSKMILTLEIPGKDSISVSVDADVHYPKRLREQIEEIMREDGKQAMLSLIHAMPEASIRRETQDTFF